MVIGVVKGLFSQAEAPTTDMSIQVFAQPHKRIDSRIQMGAQILIDIFPVLQRRCASPLQAGQEIAGFEHGQVKLLCDQNEAQPPDIGTLISSMTIRIAPEYDQALCHVISDH